VLAASDSWRSDAFAGATADEKKCPASASALRAVRMLVEIGVRFGLATTSSAARSGAGLACCRRSRCSSVGFAGSCFRWGLMRLVLIAGWRVEGVAGCLDLLVVAIAGLDRSRCTTSRMRV